MTSLRTIITLATVAALAGCAHMGAQYEPLVDLQGRDPARLQVDLRECQAFAAIRIDAERSAVAGAIAMSLLGAFLAPRGYRNEVAGRAAAIGAVGGAGEGLGTQRDIIKRCLSGRGYVVLN